MKRIRVFVALLALSFAAIPATSASANLYFWTGNSYFLESGQSGYTNYTVKELWGSKGEAAYKERAVCAGIRGLGDACVGRGYSAEYVIAPATTNAEPYIHNHDATKGQFKFYGWYEAP